MAYPKNGEIYPQIGDFEKVFQDGDIEEFLNNAESLYTKKDSQFFFLCGRVFSPKRESVFRDIEKREVMEFFYRRQDILLETLRILKKNLLDVEKDFNTGVYSSVLSKSGYSQKAIESILIEQKELNLTLKQIIKMLEKYIVSPKF